ncbi:hypothetical protein K440DRAFT_644024 [Wilcoxina mikolae CBS 423.85]|nr:hypothetical protein K440DRAFT_644024 [Wilcoxina mikolae CBS 423.85]
MSSLTQKNSVAVSDDNTPSTYDPPVTSLTEPPRLWGRGPIDLCALYASPPHIVNAPLPSQALGASTASSATRSRNTSTLTLASFYSRSKTTQTRDDKEWGDFRCEDPDFNFKDEEHDSDERREIYERHQMKLSRRFPRKAVGTADLRKFHFRGRERRRGIMRSSMIVMIRI